MGGHRRGLLGCDSDNILLRIADSVLDLVVEGKVKVTFKPEVT